VKNKNYIILGSGGFIGSKLYKDIKSINKTICISRSKKNNKNIHYKCNILKDDSWYKFIKKKSIIYFLAFENDLYKFEKNSIDFTKDYSNFCLRLSNYIINKKLNVSIIFTSTVTIYGNTKNKVINEKNYAQPISFYDFNKFMIENFFIYFSRINKIKFISLRLSNVYGSNNSSRQKNRGFLNKVIKNAYNKKDLFAYNGGKYYRDYIYIDDVIKALIISSKKIATLNGHFYNLCYGKSYKIVDVLKLIQKKVKKIGINIDIKNKKFPKNIHDIEKRSFHGSNTLFFKKTGWKPSIALEKGIDKILYSLKN